MRNSDKASGSHVEIWDEEHSLGFLGTGRGQTHTLYEPEHHHLSTKHVSPFFLLYPEAPKLTIPEPTLSL